MTVLPDMVHLTEMLPSLFRVRDGKIFICHFAIRRNHDYECPTRSQDPEHLPHRQAVVGNVLEYVGTQDQVQLRVPERV